MPVNDQETPAVRRRVHHALDTPDRAETHAHELFQELIVIAKDERDARFLAVLAQQFLDEHIVILRPIPLAPQLPAVDKIADDVKMLAVRIPQKFQQFANLGVFRAEVNVGNPDRAVARAFSRTAI